MGDYGSDDFPIYPARDDDKGWLNWCKQTLFSYLRWRKKIDDMDLSTLAYEVSQLRDEVKSLKRTMITIAASIVGSSLLFAFTVFFAIKK